MTTYTLYLGKLHGRIVYVGTTIQEPAARFRWHKANGKRFDFEVIQTFETSEEMLDEEFRLIKLYKPQFNDIKHRKQNLNVKLTPAALEARKGNDEWCQCCLKRRVNRGYTRCMYCPKETK